MSYGRNLRITLALSAVATAMTFAPSTAQSAVCNEAGVGLSGSYDVTGPTVDPNPPARFTTDRRSIGSEESRGPRHRSGAVPRAEPVRTVHSVRRRSQLIGFVFEH